MSKTTLRAGTSPFAHLLSALSPRGSRGTTHRAASGRAEDDEHRDDEDEEARKARRAEEDELRQEEDARRAGEDERRQEEDARRAEEDDGSDPEQKPESGKRAKDEDDETEKKAEDGDDDEEMAKARSEGYAAAQARARRIFSSPAAGKRPDMAAHLACNETMPSAKAIAMLEFAANGEAPAASGSRLGRRMARVVVPNPGTGGTGASSKEPSFGELAAAAAKKAGLIK